MVSKLAIIALFITCASSSLTGTNHQLRESKPDGLNAITSSKDNFLPDESKKKKTLLLLTSKGGYGHIAACNALEKLLSRDYTIKIINPFEEVFSSLDLIKTLSRGSMDGESFYNTLLKNGHTRFTNFMCSFIAPPLITMNRKKMISLMSDVLRKEKPDALISVIPFLNYPIHEAARMCNIPFLLITTDSDLKNWLHNVDRIKNPNFPVTIGFDVKQATNRLNKVNIRKENTLLTGFPIRSDFLESKNKQKIQVEWGFPENKFTVLIMMGGAGGKESFGYVKSLLKSNLDIHGIICVGRNQELGKKIERFYNSRRSTTKATISIIPFTQRVSDLMACSDVVITKPGPGSLNEALHMNLPVLLDKTGPTLFWEQANIDFVKAHNFGDQVTSFSKVVPLLKKYMDDKNYYEETKQHIASYKKPSFDDEIKKIIFKLCPPQ